VLVAQNEFEETADADGDGIREHVSHAARRAGIADLSVFRVDARSGRGIAEFRGALTRLLSQNANDRLLRVCDSIAEELCSVLFLERAEIDGERLSDAAMVSKVERELKALRLANAQARSTLAFERSAMTCGPVSMRSHRAT
jgi:hypothetical protein